MNRLCSLLTHTIPVFSATLLLVPACSSSNSNGSAESGTATASSSGTAGSTAGSTTSGHATTGTSGTTGTTGTTGTSGTTGSSGASTSRGSGSSGATSSGTTSSGSSSGGTSSGTTAAQCTMANAACVSDNNACNVTSVYDLYDNQWNCGGNSCGPESAYGCDNGDGTVSFVVTSNQPAGNTAVLTYPAMQDNFNTNPLVSSFTSITSTFQETSPHVGDYEVAYDLWLNNQDNEIMVWVDNYNQTPGGNKVKSNVSIAGQSWDIWWGPDTSKSTPMAGYLVFYATSTMTSGTVDLLALFNYAMQNGYLWSNSTIGQLSFGIEVCSTNGQDATWTINDYSITTK